VCNGIIKKLNQEEVISGIITYEETQGYRFADVKYFDNLEQMQKLFEAPHIKFVKQIQNSRIIKIIKNKKRKEVVKIILKLKKQQTT